MSKISSTVIAFMFALHGKQKTLTNVLRWNNEEMQLDMLMHGSWVSLVSRPTAYANVIANVFGVQASNEELKLRMKAPPQFAALWNLRLAPTNLMTVVPEAIGFSVDGCLRLTAFTHVASIMQVRFAPGTSMAFSGWIVETRQANNAMLPTERYTLADEAAAKKAWSEIKAHDGTSEPLLAGPPRKESVLTDQIGVLTNEAKEAVKAAAEKMAEAERERERAREREELAKREREEQARLARIEAERAAQREAALRHTELLGKDVEQLNNNDYATRMRSKRALRTT